MADENRIVFPDEVEEIKAKVVHCVFSNMADENRIVFPDEVEEIKAKAVHYVFSNTADENRIVFPDEVEEIKAKAAKSAETEDAILFKSNSLEEPLQSNVIQTPYNCPHVQKRDGVLHNEI